LESVVIRLLNVHDLSRELSIKFSIFDEFVWILKLTQRDQVILWNGLAVPNVSNGDICR